MSETWQEDYDRELRRTAGYGCYFVPRFGGGWWHVFFNDGSERFDRVQRSHIEQRTGILRNRPDFGRDES